jgi:hypothetical protein
MHFIWSSVRIRKDNYTYKLREDLAYCKQYNSSYFFFLQKDLGLKENIKQYKTP